MHKSRPENLQSLEINLTTADILHPKKPATTRQFVIYNNNPYNHNDPYGLDLSIKKISQTQFLFFRLQLTAMLESITKMDTKNFELSLGEVLKTISYFPRTEFEKLELYLKQISVLLPANPNMPQSQVEDQIMKAHATLSLLQEYFIKNNKKNLKNSIPSGKESITMDAINKRADLMKSQKINPANANTDIQHPTEPAPKVQLVSDNSNFFNCDTYFRLMIESIITTDTKNFELYLGRMLESIHKMGTENFELYLFKKRKYLFPLEPEMSQLETDDQIAITRKTLSLLGEYFINNKENLENIITDGKESITMDEIHRGIDFIKFLKTQATPNPKVHAPKVKLFGYSTHLLNCELHLGQMLENIRKMDTENFELHLGQMIENIRKMGTENFELYLDQMPPLLPVNSNIPQSEVDDGIIKARATLSLIKEHFINNNDDKNFNNSINIDAINKRADLIKKGMIDKNDISVIRSEVKTIDEDTTFIESRKKNTKNRSHTSRIRDTDEPLNSILENINKEKTDTIKEKCVALGSTILDNNLCQSRITTTNKEDEYDNLLTNTRKKITIDEKSTRSVPKYTSLER